jgi:hypothetical protein
MKRDDYIIQRIVDKEKSALNDLYDRYISYIYQLVKKNVVNLVDTEKVITRIFHIIWNSPESLKAETHMSVAITKLCLESCKSFHIENN